jgi:Flp pilus assembly protein TadG
MKRLLSRVRPNERGVVIIWIAFFMLFMLGFVALGIDVAKLMATRTELQNAADAAALAGASAVNSQTGNVMADSAVARAQETAVKNKAFVNEPLPVQLLAADVSFPTNRQVKVVVRRDATAGGAVVTHVAQVLGIRSLAITATAVAEASPASEQCERLVPMGAIPPPGQAGFLVGCSNVYSLKLGAGSGTTGNYQALDFPGCDEGTCAGYSPTGANTYRCLLASGYSCCVKIGQTIQTEPGNMTGPTRQGLQDRWDADNDRRSNICYSAYTGNRNRIVNVPVIQSLGNGRTDVKVIGFAAFFLRTRPTGGSQQPVEAEFIYDIVPGSGGGGNSTVFAIRLVK